jgi:hypothetical protein
MITKLAPPAVVRGCQFSKLERANDFKRKAKGRNLSRRGRSGYQSEAEEVRPVSFWAISRMIVIGDATPF